MTTQDRDRLKVLHEVNKKHITQREAAEQLGLSRRWVKKLMKRLRKEGDRGVIHRLRGKASNRKIALKVQQKAVKIVRAEYLVDAIGYNKVQGRPFKVSELVGRCLKLMNGAKEEAA